MSKKPILTKLVSEHFVLSCHAPADACFDTPWEVRNRLTRKEKKSGIQKDTDSVLASVTFRTPDEFGLSEAIYSFGDMLNSEDIVEIIKSLSENISSLEKLFFIRIKTDGFDEDIKAGLDKIEFMADPLDENALVKECTSAYYLPLFMSIGMCLGISGGYGLFDNMSIGLAVGLSIGIAVGAAIDSKKKLNAKKNWASRLNR